MGKRELVALLNLSSWCLVMVERLFLAVPWGCLRFVIMVFPDHTHLLFLNYNPLKYKMDNSIFIVSICMGKSIRMKKVRHELHRFDYCFEEKKTNGTPCHIKHIHI